jgi:predicted small lipoprotein YifL
MNQRRINLHRGVIVVCAACALCACGQKGALYLPDHAPQPVIAPPAAPADAATAPGTTTTRKVPRDPDPATAR